MKNQKGESYELLRIGKLGPLWGCHEHKHERSLLLTGRSQEGQTKKKKKLRHLNGLRIFQAWARGTLLRMHELITFSLIYIVLHPE